MGIYRSDHLVVGWKLNMDLMNHPDFDMDRFYEKAPDEFVYDGMCGKYAVFGKLALYAGNDNEGFTFQELEPADLVLSDDELQELRELFRECTFGLDISDWAETKEPKAFIFSHFS